MSKRKLLCKTIPRYKSNIFNYVPNINAVAYLETSLFKGKCVCRDGYVGDTCFVKKSDVLIITDVEGGGLCDLIHGEDCHDCLEFHTENLLKGFKCHISTSEVPEF